MATTVERVDEALSIAGFTSKLAINRNVFAGGDGNSVEDAPIGYYRFHFWKNDEQWKDHENWIANTDVTGPICISLMEDQQVLDRRIFYRMLIRSVFSTKSVVLLEEEIFDILGGKKSSNRLRILGAALKVFIDHERDKATALEDEFGAMSIRTLFTLNSPSDELVKSLPTSRLKDGIESQESEGIGLLRRMSMRGGGGFKGEGLRTCSDVEPPMVSSPAQSTQPEQQSTRKRFKDLSKVNPFEMAKSFTLVKDKELYRTLLDLERALDPKVCHFDVIIAEGSTTKKSQRDETWKAFTQILGQKLTKQTFVEQSVLLSKTGRAPSEFMERLRKSEMQKEKELVLPTPLQNYSDEKQSIKRKHIANFVKNEASYLGKLQLVDEYFLQGLDPEINPDSPLGLQSFKNIFEGFDKFLTLHESLFSALLMSEGMENNVIIKPSEVSEDFVLRKMDQGIITAKSISQVLIEFCSRKQFRIYSQLFNDFEMRQSNIKEEMQKRPLFRDVVEVAAHDPRSNKTTLDQFLAHFFQHLPRYPLQIADIIRVTLHSDDESLEALNQAYRELHETIRKIEVVKKANTETTIALQLPYKIANYPADACGSKKHFLFRAAAYEVVKGEADFSKRLTLFLFNDSIIGARKRRAQQGKLDQKPSGKIVVTHDFMFMAPISGTSLQRIDVTAKVKGKNNVKTFSLDLPLDADVWNDGRRMSLESCADDYCGHFVLVPKKQEKLTAMLEKFNDAKHQQFLSNSPADIYTKIVDDKMLYFHVFKQTDYQNWQHRNRFGILYSHNSSLPNLSMLFPDDETEAVMVIQAMQSAFRWMIKCRDCIVAALECFEPTREFHPASSISSNLTQALINCHLLHSIYPPFGPQVEHLMRQQLEHKIEPFSRGLMRKFKEIVNRMKNIDPVNGMTDNSDTFSITSVENNSILEEMGNGGGGKRPSMFGKMFGRIKSPLSRKLYDIPE